MMIATDGACKRLGKPDCTSTGVAWIKTDDGRMLFKAYFEEESTSQRGEIHGLLEALEFARDNRMDPEEDVIIITDSEYLLNTVGLDWCFKWKNAGWITGSGDRAKNQDLWEKACELIEQIGKAYIYMQWTKGHLVDYTPGNTKAAMLQDPSGVELYTRIATLAMRPSERARIVKDFNDNRIRHDKDAVPDQVAIEWVVANVTADVLAAYVETVWDAAYLAKLPKQYNI
jgi:ribonuclease HI